MATYTSLQSDIILAAMRTGDSEFAAAVPGFITRAENRIMRRLRVSDMEAIAYILAEDLTDGAVALPDDFLEVRQVFADTVPKKPLELASPGYVYDWVDTQSSGIPCFFDITGSTIRTYPMSSYGLRIDYYASPEALSTDEPTNWLLEDAYDLYYYGALIEAAIFMREEGASMVDVYAKAFERAMLDIQEDDRRQRYPYGSVHVRNFTP